MTEPKGYSLWLMPSGEVYDRLNAIISELSKEHNTPYFEPHVTLIGEVLGSEEEVIQKTTQLASLVPKYKVELSGLTHLNNYYKCLFLSAKETDDVMRANQKARRIFGQENNIEYKPHLSLMYGDHPPKIKEQIISEIGEKLNLGFDVNSIHLFSANGEPKNWYRVKEFLLK